MPSPLDVFFLAISSILFVMYVVFLISLIAYHSNAPLRSGFFKLTFMLGLFDMTHMYIFLRFPSFGWMTDDFYLKLPPGVAHYASCTMWALAFNQHVTVLFIALNRFSAVVFPYGHKRKRELRLATCGFIIFFSMFVYTIGVANMGVSESPGKQQDHRNIWMAASDIFSGINPILLIIVSKSLRNRFLAVLCCSCKERHYSPSQSM
ncbi:hypothetical protein FO519_006305 [Halicephalobus sp. NKZ332]|nr:hypothetical protein FO519_006305 [Halicephalobus sp. NKZ332]